MKERGIIFTGEMVRAILDGRKTQTRRVVKHIPDLGSPDMWCKKIEIVNQICGDFKRYCPYGQPGDRLWVRETWAPWPELWTRSDIRDQSPLYRAERPFVGNDVKWRPSNHMPRWASRINLEITDVRVERVQDITDEDALEEGVDPDGYIPRTQFEALWNSIYEKRGHGWDKNPWVWVIEFKVVK